MSEDGTTISVWQCFACASYNDLSEKDCYHCHKARRDKWSFLQIGYFTPAAKEILERLGKSVPKRKRAAKKGEKAASQKPMSEKEKLERAFLKAWQNYGTGQGIAQQYVVKSKRHQTPERKLAKTYKIDFAFQELKLAIEIQGGTYRNGRHNRGKGYAEDRKRIRDLQYMDWVVLEYTTDDLQPGTKRATIAEVVLFVDKLSDRQSVAGKKAA